MIEEESEEEGDSTFRVQVEGLAFPGLPLRPEAELGNRSIEFLRCFRHHSESH